MAPTTPGRFESSLHLPAPPAEVFAFLADARHLDQVTPGWFRLRILSPLPIRMEEGARIDYRMSLGGIPFPWSSRVVQWEPPHLFTYEQERGPYRRFRHLHQVVEEGDGSRVVDVVDYAVPGGDPLDRLVVGRLLAGIFRHRADELRRRFPGTGVSGGSGRGDPRP